MNFHPLVVAWMVLGLLVGVALVGIWWWKNQ